MVHILRRLTSLNDQATSASQPDPVQQMMIAEFFFSDSLGIGDTSLANSLFKMTASTGVESFNITWIWYDTIQDMFKRKPFGHGSWESLKSQWLRVSHALVLGLHEGSVRLQLIRLSLHEKCTWMMWVKIVGELFGTTLEGRPDGIPNTLEFTLWTCDLQKTLSYILWISLWSHPKSGVRCSFKSPALIPYCKHAFNHINGTLGNNTNCVCVRWMCIISYPYDVI